MNKWEGGGSGTVAAEGDDGNGVGGRVEASQGEGKSGGADERR